MKRHITCLKPSHGKGWLALANQINFKEFEAVWRLPSRKELPESYVKSRFTKFGIENPKQLSVWQWQIGWTMLIKLQIFFHLFERKYSLNYSDLCQPRITWSRFSIFKFLICEKLTITVIFTFVVQIHILVQIHWKNIVTLIDSLMQPFVIRSFTTTLTN